MKALLLNVTYEPIRLISWKRAVTLTFLKKADVLSEYDIPLRSRYLELKMPAVIILKKYHKSRESVRMSRENIYARDQYTCQYCGNRFKPDELTLDHVMPQSRGGISSWKNLVASCATCNSEKSNNTPKEAGMPLLRTPFKPKWMPAVLVKAIENKEVPKQWVDWIKWINQTDQADLTTGTDTDEEKDG